MCSGNDLHCEERRGWEAGFVRLLPRASHSARALARAGCEPAVWAGGRAGGRSAHQVNCLGAFGVGIQQQPHHLILSDVVVRSCKVEWQALGLGHAAWHLGVSGVALRRDAAVLCHQCQHMRGGRARDGAGSTAGLPSQLPWRRQGKRPASTAPPLPSCSRQRHCAAADVPSDAKQLLGVGGSFVGGPYKCWSTHLIRCRGASREERRGSTPTAG